MPYLIRVLNDLKIKKVCFISKITGEATIVIVI